MRPTSIIEYFQVKKSPSSGPPTAGEQNGTFAMITPPPAQETSYQGMVSRYSSAYLLGAFLDKAGSFMRYLALALGFLIIAGLAAYWNQIMPSRMGRSVILFLLPIVFLVGILFLLGALLSAAAQIMLATLDTAVNTSPFLTHSQKAQVLHLKAMPVSNAGSPKTPNLPASPT